MTGIYDVLDAYSSHICSATKCCVYIKLRLRHTPFVSFYHFLSSIQILHCVHDFISLYLIFSLGLNQIRQKLAKQINFQFNFFIAAMTSKVDHSHQNWYENVIKVNGVIIIPSTWKMSLTVSDHYIHWQFSCETVSGFFQTVLYLIPVLDIRLNYPQPLTGVKLKGILVCTTMQVVQLFWSMTLPPHTWTATWTLLDLINIATAIPN